MFKTPYIIFIVTNMRNFSFAVHFTGKEENRSLHFIWRKKEGQCCVFSGRISGTDFP